MKLHLNLPLPTSLNALYVQEFKFNKMTRRSEPTGGRILSPAGRNSRKLIEFQAKNQVSQTDWNIDISHNTDIIVEVTIFFPRTGMDADAIWKLLLDALQGIVYHNDKCVIPRVKRRYIDKDNPRITAAIYPGEWRGVFDSTDECVQFEDKCKTCSRYRSGSCSILKNALESRVQSEITCDNVCTAYKKKKGVI